MLIEGRNAVSEALKGNVTIEKVLVLKDGGHAIFDISKECRKRGIVVQTVDKAALDRLSTTKHHQGIIAVSTDFKYTDFDELLDTKSDSGRTFIILDGIEDPHNIGAIIRVAECAGCTGIIIPKRRNCGVTDTAVKVSCGASAYVKVAKVGNINDAIREMKERNIYVFAADMAGDDIYKTNLTGDVAFVIGGEGNGVHELTKKLCDGVIALPQYGKVNSLNASVACGIVVYECGRQKANVKGN